MHDAKERKMKKQNKTDIFTDNFLDFGNKPGSTFYNRIVKDFCV